MSVGVVQHLLVAIGDVPNLQGVITYADMHRHRLAPGVMGKNQEFLHMVIDFFEGVGISTIMTIAMVPQHVTIELIGEIFIEYQVELVIYEVSRRWISAFLSG